MMPMRTIAIAALFVIPTSWSSGGAQNTQTISRTAAYPARTAAQGQDDIFQGLFFGVGPIAPKLIEFWPNANSMPKGQLNLARRLTAEVRRKNPAYLRALEGAVTSGDRIAISDAIEDGVDLVRATAIATGLVAGQHGGERMGRGLPDPTIITNCLIATCWVITMQGQETHAGLQSVAQLTSASGHLRHDRFVDAIAMRLSENSPSRLPK